MNELVLNKKSWHSWLYQSAYSTSLPESLCIYFWKLLFAIITFPLCLPSHSFNFLKERGDPKYGWCWPAGFVLTILFLLIGVLPYEVPTFLTFGLLIKWFFTGFAIFILILGIGIGIILLVELIKDRLPEKKVTITYIKKPNIIKEYFKAFIGKYCPKITWK